MSRKGIAGRMIRLQPQVRARFGGVLALLAALALCLQAAIPGMAHGSPTHQAVEICTEHGKKVVLVELPADPSDPSSCAKCPVCVTAASVALPPPAKTSPSPALRVAKIAGPTASSSAAVFHHPPRPPGQGPPRVS